MSKLTNDANWTFDGYINGVQFNNSYVYQDTLEVLRYWQAAKEQIGRAHV